MTQRPRRHDDEGNSISMLPEKCRSAISQKKPDARKPLFSDNSCYIQLASSQNWMFQRRWPGARADVYRRFAFEPIRRLTLRPGSLLLSNFRDGNHDAFSCTPAKIIATRRRECPDASILNLQRSWIEYRLFRCTRDRPGTFAPILARIFYTRRTNFPRGTPFH